MSGERLSAPIGNLAVLETLGATTWLAQHPGYGRCVISIDEPDVIEAKRETLASLEHPGIRRSLGVLSARQGLAHVATHLSGVPASRCDRGHYHRRPRAAIELGVELLGILEHVHGRGIAHGRIAARHVIVGEQVGLVGFGKPRGGRPQDDLDAIGGLLFELVTGEPWTTWSPPAAYFVPDLGYALDEWLEILIAPERPPPIDRLRAMLRAVGASMPPPPPPSLPDGVLPSPVAH